MVTSTEVEERPATADLNKYLCFLLGDRRYAANILRIKEIIEHIEVTAIPMMPGFLSGFTNLRGKVVPVIDLGKRLGMHGATIGRRTCIVIMEVVVHGNTMDVGIIVDAVSQVADIAPDQIDAAPSFGGNLPMEYIEGMGKVNDEFIVLFNVDRLLSLDDLQALHDAGRVAATAQVTSRTVTEDDVVSEAGYE